MLTPGAGMIELPPILIFLAWRVYFNGNFEIFLGG